MSLHHLNVMAAILVCNLLLCSAQPAARTPLWKFLTSKQSIGSSRNPLTQQDLVDDLARENSLCLGSSPGRLQRCLNLDDVISRGIDGGYDTTLESLPDKRFQPSAFFGSRGKRLFFGLSSAFDNNINRGLLPQSDTRIPPLVADRHPMVKRFDPSGFYGSRGKRYLSGLEAMVLSQLYQKLDDEKWKRQSMRGFQAARG